MFSAQEEVGLRGARTAAWSIAPDYALAVDVTDVDDTPGSQRRARLGWDQGAAVKVMDSSVICHPAMVALLEDTAREGDIPVQRDIMRAGGTDAGAIHLTRIRRASPGASQCPAGISTPRRRPPACPTRMPASGWQPPWPSGRWSSPEGAAGRGEPV